MNRIVAAMLLMTTIMSVGCLGQEAPSGQRNDAPRESRAENQKPKTVVVNEGMSKEEEEKLNDRIAALEEEANEEPDEQTAQEPEAAEPSQEAEDAARVAAQDYYAAAAGGNYRSEEHTSELQSRQYPVC